MPDLTILLDLPVEAGLARKSAEVTRFEAYHDLAYHERVRAAFLAFAAAEPERYAIVDATLDEDARARRRHRGARPARRPRAVPAGRRRARAVIAAATVNRSRVPVRMPR